MEDKARNAYDSMSESVHGLSTISGKPLPPWEELPQSVKDAWVAALQAVEGHIAPPVVPPP